VYKLSDANWPGLKPAQSESIMLHAELARDKKTKKKDSRLCHIRPKVEILV
jgi:hypothetical protein